MSAQIPTNKSPRFTGTHFAICMAAFFGIIIAVNIGMATLASTTWTGLVVRNSYVASQQFNATLAAAKIQKSTGWRSEITYQNGKIVVQLKDRDGLSLKLTQPQISVGRPVYEQQDKVVTLSLLDDGSASTMLRLEPGEWSLRLEGLIDGKPYRRDARVRVDATHSGEVQ